MTPTGEAHSQRSVSRRVVGIIPARYASTRLPGKVLIPIHGYPMVHHVYQRATECRSLEAVIIATDSPRVATICAQLGDRVMLTGSQHQSGTDRVAEAARSMAADLIVNIQGDEPLLDPHIIDQLVTHMQAHPELPMGTVGSTTLAPEDLTEPNIVKVVGRDELATGFFRTPPLAPVEGYTLRHVGLYAYRRPFLEQFTAQPPTPSEREQGLEQLRALEMGISIGLVTVAYDALAVDTPADLERVMAHWRPSKAFLDE